MDSTGLFDKMTGKQIDASKKDGTWYFLRSWDIQRFERNSVAGEKMINGIGLIEKRISPVQSQSPHNEHLFCSSLSESSTAQAIDCSNS